MGSKPNAEAWAFLQELEAENARIKYRHEHIAELRRCRDVAKQQGNRDVVQFCDEMIDRLVFGGISLAFYQRSKS